MGEAGCLRDAKFHFLQCERLNGSVVASSQNFIDSATGGNIVSVEGDSLADGVGLNVTSISPDKSTGALVNIAQTGTGANQAAPTLVVSTSATGATSGGGGSPGAASFTAATQLEGNAVSISADLLEGGTALSVTSTSPAKADGALVNISQTGTGDLQSEPTLVVSTSATGATSSTGGTAGAASFTAATQLEGNAVSISADSLEGGTALSVTSISPDKSGGALVNIAQTGTGAAQSEPTLVVSTSATGATSGSGGTAGAASFTAATQLEGNVVSISADLLAGGTALSVASASPNKAAGALVNIEQTVVTSNQTAPTLVVSTSATDGSGAGVALFTGNLIESGNVVEISATGLTGTGADAGSALKITGTTAKAGLTVDHGLMHMNGGGVVRESTVLTGAGSGGSVDITAAQLIAGVAYFGATGGAGAVSLTFPTAADVRNALTAAGITAQAGTMLPSIPVVVTDASDITVVETTADSETTVRGGDALGGGADAVITQDQPAVIHYLFTSSTDAQILLTRSAA